MIRITAQRHECRSRAGVTTRASSKETSITGNWNVIPNSAMRAKIRPEVRNGIVDLLQVGPAHRTQEAEGVRRA